MNRNIKLYTKNAQRMRKNFSLCSMQQRSTTTYKDVVIFAEKKSNKRKTSGNRKRKNNISSTAKWYKKIRKINTIHT